MVVCGAAPQGLTLYPTPGLILPLSSPPDAPAATSAAPAATSAWTSRWDRGFCEQSWLQRNGGCPSSRGGVTTAVVPPPPQYKHQVEDTKKEKRTRIPYKPNYSLNLWSIMKNCIGKELSKIPMPVSGAGALGGARGTQRPPINLFVPSR